MLCLAVFSFYILFFELFFFCLDRLDRLCSFFVQRPTGRVLFRPNSRRAQKWKEPKSSSSVKRTITPPPPRLPPTQARRGLDRGFKPELTLEGTGGTYFLQDAARQKVAVFKPQDEEPFAPNNPR